MWLHPARKNAPITFDMRATLPNDRNPLYDTLRMPLIVDAYPEGPYRLFGNCLGGNTCI